jgi:hypothetical protein
MSENIQKMLKVEFGALMDSNQEIFSDLYENMTGEELDVFVERAHENGQVLPEEWEYWTEREIRVEDLFKVVELIHQMYRRLGLIIPLYVAGGDGKA